MENLDYTLFSTHTPIPTRLDPRTRDPPVIDPGVGNPLTCAASSPTSTPARSSWRAAASYWLPGPAVAARAGGQPSQPRA